MPQHPPEARLWPPHPFRYRSATRTQPGSERSASPSAHPQPRTPHPAVPPVPGPDLRRTPHRPKQPPAPAREFPFAPCNRMRAEQSRPCESRNTANRVPRAFNLLRASQRQDSATKPRIGKNLAVPHHGLISLIGRSGLILSDLSFLFTSAPRLHIPEPQNPETHPWTTSQSRQPAE
jgi:hypothetical protein